MRVAQYAGMGNHGGAGYPSDASDDEWSFVAPYLTLCREDAKQREYPLRAVFNAVRWLVRPGAHWRMMPNDLPPWPVVYQQTQRWIRAGCFEIMVEDLRSLLREFADLKPQPSAMVLDSRTLRSTPESGARAGYDGAKRGPSSIEVSRLSCVGSGWPNCSLRRSAMCLDRLSFFKNANAGGFLVLFSSLSVSAPALLRPPLPPASQQVLMQPSPRPLVGWGRASSCCPDLYGIPLLQVQ